MVKTVLAFILPIFSALLVFLLIWGFFPINALHKLGLSDAMIGGAKILTAAIISLLVASFVQKKFRSDEKHPS